jgi:hypothetical protein
MMMRPSSSTLRRSLVVVVLALAAVAALGLARGWWRSDPDDAAARDRRADLPGDLFVPNDRTLKADLLDELGEAPDVLVFGGSRATRFEPSYLERLTGLSGFNFAFQNGRPEDAWAFVNRVCEVHPDARPRLLWFIHVEAFRAQGLSVGLVQDERLSCYFPKALIEREREKLPRTAAEMPERRDLELTTYGPDGVVLRNRYDIRREKGYTLDRALDWAVDKALERYSATTPALDPRSVKYFEKTLRLMRRIGTEPVIVLMPLHPALLEAVRDAGWEKRHEKVLAWLRELQERHDFTVLDLSRLESVGGDPEAFYDGFHIMRHNARRVLDTVVEQAPGCFD